MKSPRIRVIIPALNEEESVKEVVRGVRELVEEVIVVDNGSSDQTGAMASSAGATVLHETRKGYGNACLKGIAYLEDNPTDIVVFMDADGSDDPEQLPVILAPLISEDYDLIIGSRMLGQRQRGSMTFPQAFGNHLAAFLMKLLAGADFTDLGPFRAIRYESLRKLSMADRNYGWTVEMQIKAHEKGLRYKEVPVSYLRRSHGVSKVSGTLRGTIMAGYKIILTIFRYI